VLRANQDVEATAGVCVVREAIDDQRRACAERLAHAYDDVCVVATPSSFFAVGEFYVDFRQVTDDEVRELLSAE